MTDFALCRWPDGKTSADESLALLLDSLNEPGFGAALAGIAEDRACGRDPAVVSFSHFLPLQELMPPRAMLHVKCLARASGSDPLLRRVVALRSTAHVFGHTHFRWDVTVAGTRFVQPPLGYPRDRAMQLGGTTDPFLVYDAATGRPGPGRPSFWSACVDPAGAAFVRPPWFAGEVARADEAVARLRREGTGAGAGAGAGGDSAG